MPYIHHVYLEINGALQILDPNAITIVSFLTTDTLRFQVNVQWRPFLGQIGLSSATNLGFAIRLVEIPPNGVAAINGWKLIGEQLFTRRYAEGTHTFDIKPCAFDTYDRSEYLTASRDPNLRLAIFVSLAYWPTKGEKDYFYNDQTYADHAAKIMTPHAAGTTFSLADLGNLLMHVLIGRDQTNPRGMALLQDEVDVLRQEYVDFGLSSTTSAPFVVPSRTEVVPSLGHGLNVGNYSVQLDRGLQQVYGAVVQAYRSHEVVTPDGKPLWIGNEKVRISANAAAGIGSAYRNPRRNLAAGSKIGTSSRHVWGAGLDLSPVTPTTGTTNSTAGIPLDLHQHLFPTLLKSAELAMATLQLNRPDAFADFKGKKVPVGDPSENHVHLEWF